MHYIYIHPWMKCMEMPSYVIGPSSSSSARDACHPVASLGRKLSNWRWYDRLWYCCLELMAIMKRCTVGGFCEGQSKPSFQSTNRVKFISILHHQDSGCGWLKPLHAVPTLENKIYVVLCAWIFTFASHGSTPQQPNIRICLSVFSIQLAPPSNSAPSSSQAPVSEPFDLDATWRHRPPWKTIMFAPRGSAGYMHMYMV